MVRGRIVFFMTETLSPLDRLEEFGGQERRAPGETYWRRGRLRKAALFYVQAKSSELPAQIREFIKSVNAEGVPPLEAETEPIYH